MHKPFKHCQWSKSSLEFNLIGIGNRNWFQLNQNIFDEPNVCDRSFLSKKVESRLVEKIQDPKLCKQKKTVICCLTAKGSSYEKDYNQIF